MFRCNEYSTQNLYYLLSLWRTTNICFVISPEPHFRESVNEDFPPDWLFFLLFRYIWAHMCSEPIHERCPGQSLGG